MTGVQRAITIVGLLLIAGAAGGVLVRRRYSAWRFFFVYLLAVFAGGVLPQIWPDRFFTPEFWQVKETVYVALRFGMAAELAVRTFRSFPGALATLRRVSILILLVTLAAVVTAPSGESGYTDFLSEVQPRVLNGSVWVFTAIAGLVLYYRLPIGRFQKSVLLSYVPYVLVFTVFISHWGRGGWRSGLVVVHANQIAYVLLVAYWNLAVWRRDPERRAAPPPPPASSGGGAGPNPGPS
jgi:hypothetical protein